MSASTSGLSASVTRILSLTGFPKELKTKDIHAAFSEWENVGGGFKIKWRDDTSLLIVFHDATVAKRAYLHTLAFPPAVLSAGLTAVIKPYDGPDAQTVIQTVNTRGQHTSNPSRGHNVRAASVSVIPSRSASGGQNNGTNFRNVQNTHVGGASPSLNGREPSPTLPSLPSHPTLNELINSAVTHEDPAILHAEGPPRIGDPGKRMLGAALGVRLPGLGSRMSNTGVMNGDGSALRDIQRAMGGLTVAE